MFPDGRTGKIVVDYQSHGPNWTLAVKDDGVGVPPDVANTPPGLGTSIVEALTRQLHARVQVADAHPGTSVSIIHTQIAAVDNSGAPSKLHAWGYAVAFIGPAQSERAPVEPKHQEGGWPEVLGDQHPRTQLNGLVAPARFHVPARGLA